MTLAHAWKDGETITSALLNDLEERADKAGTPGEKGEKGDPGETGAKGAKGDKGDAGADGRSIKAIALTADASGKITGGTATLDDESTLDITVTVAAE